MSDVIIGPDGKPRCAWAGTGDSPLVRYHDNVWGARTYDESALFEALTLGVFQAGLSWEIVFGKRDAFQKVFHGFDVAKDIRSELRARCAASPDAPMIQLNTAPPYHLA
jgi:DNA-3-methyladenine glycosylase I